MQKNIILYLLLVWLGLSSCVPMIITVPYPTQESKGKKEDEPQGERKEEQHEALGIPNGHLPPPGHCRIWYPGRPPGQQPPPQRCPIPLSRVPLGTWVVSRADESNKRVIVNVYHQQRPGVVVDTRYYTVN